MKKTVMKSHLEWLKARIFISKEMEKTLLEEEKNQIIDIINSGNTNTKNANDHIYRCAEIILNDKNISEETILIMFMTYKKLLTNELNKNGG